MGDRNGYEANRTFFEVDGRRYRLDFMKAQQPPREVWRAPCAVPHAGGRLEQCAVCEYAQRCREERIVRQVTRDAFGNLPLCTCLRCQEIAAVPLDPHSVMALREEHLVALRKQVSAMVELAQEDLFLGVNDLTKEDAPKRFKEALQRFARLAPKKQHDERANMKSAYEWFMSDERSLFVLGDLEGDVFVVEGCLPFTVACEVLSTDPEAHREDPIWKRMDEWGLTEEMALDPEIPLVGMENMPVIQPAPKPKRQRGPVKTFREMFGLGLENET